jgi:hypothetical protein
MKKKKIETSFCFSHLEKVDLEGAELKKKLKPGHPLHILISEHEIILGFLDKLEELKEKIEKENFDEKNLKELKDISHHLIEAEPHHQREEKVLFPETEKRGIFGPTEVMRREHEELRKEKKKLKELSELSEKEIKKCFRKFREKFNKISEFILSVLREHIFKENNILYPMAFEVIKEKEIWQRIKKECDKIGYCCFTPKG